MGRLFDDLISEGSSTLEQKEVSTLDKLKDLDNKIADAITKVKTLKEEKASLEKRVKELENRLIERDEEIRALASEKSSIKDQISDLLEELDTIQASSP